MFPLARRRFSRTKPLRMTFPSVEGGGRKSLSVGARSKDTPRTGPHTVVFWKRKHNTARELRFDILLISSLRPFHRFLRPASQNLSPADTYPLYPEGTEKVLGYRVIIQ